MSKEILNSLLKEYSQKKLNAEIDLNKRKESLYLKIPRLQEIEDNLNNLGFLTTKSLLKNSSLNMKDLKNKFELLKLEKLKILNENNLDYSYLEPFYECSICKDSGYITDSNYKSDMCSCLKQHLLDISFNKSNMSNLDKENFHTFNENIFSNDVDLAKYKFNISPRNNILDIKEKCINFINNFDDVNSKNLLFTGNTGLR